jgi:hypothetical protein
MDEHSESDGPSSRPTAETDPRFPSGPWVGFWIQRELGRQTMRLSLGFSAGKIIGAGVDIIGSFTFAGTYDLKSGRCLLTKRYHGGHSVDYDGVNEGEGLWLWGLWNIGAHSRGGFHLWPEGEEDPTQRRLKRRIPKSRKKDRQLAGAFSK